jgi:hypothetical protein
MTSHQGEDRSMLRSALGATAALLSKHAAAAHSLITGDEDAVSAAITCCALLLREHAVDVATMIKAVEILARLAEAEQPSWRELSQLHTRPLAAALTGCDEAFTEQLHTICEVLLFQKPISLLLQRQLAVFRIRRTAAPAGVSDTAALVRAEALLAPLLGQAEALVSKWAGHDVVFPSRLRLTQLRAFWRGFFGNCEDADALDSGCCELDHLAYGAGRALGGRELLPDVLQWSRPGWARAPATLAILAAAAGNPVAVAALNRSGRAADLSRCMEMACRTCQVQVLHLIVSLGWNFDVSGCLRAAAVGEIAGDTRRQLLTLLRQHDLWCVATALRIFPRYGDSQCVQSLLNAAKFDYDDTIEALRAAAKGGHVNIMNLLWEHGAAVTADTFACCANVATLQWCRERGCSVDVEFVRLAVSHGRLFQLEWAASDCDIRAFLDARVFDAAANNGHMHVCEWLRVHGCPWDSRVVRWATAAERWPSVVFALRHGCPVDDVPVRDLCADMPLDQLKLGVQAIRDSGRSELVSLPALFQAIKGRAKVPAAEWLICELGVAVTAEDCEGWYRCPLGNLAATYGCLRLLRHLCERGLYAPGPADVRAALIANKAWRRRWSPGGCPLAACSRHLQRGAGA